MDIRQLVTQTVQRLPQHIIKGLMNNPLLDAPTERLQQVQTSSELTNLIPEGQTKQNLMSRLDERKKRYGKLDDYMMMAEGITNPVSTVKNTKLTTKVLDRLKGKTKVKKQFISDLTNMGDIRQSERELIRNALDELPEGKVDVRKFVNEVQKDLLPLKATNKSPDFYGKGGVEPGNITMYENTSLSPELRGNVADYYENIYQSPIKTNAGNIHFSQLTPEITEGYFAHTRVEDLAEAPSSYKFDSRGLIDQKTDELISRDAGRDWYDKINKEMFQKPTETRRVIEIQSDLFQKGGLEREGLKQRASSINEFGDELATIDRFGNTEIRKAGETQKMIDARQQEISQLQSYRNTWHERIIKEEVKKAAQDGKTKLQFPTGETAMKIEGLGDVEQFSLDDGIGLLTKDNMKVGQDITSGEIHEVADVQHNKWKITEVLDDGRFKAVPKREVDLYSGREGLNTKMSSSSQYKTVGDMPKNVREKWIKERLEAFTETFDISGKIDKSNPIYKFYEKQIGKFVKNKYNAKQITDPQGVKWWEVSVKPETRNLPIEAFSMLPGLGIAQVARLAGRDE